MLLAGQTIMGLGSVFTGAALIIDLLLSRINCDSNAAASEDQTTNEYTDICIPHQLNNDSLQASTYLSDHVRQGERGLFGIGEASIDITGVNVNQLCIIDNPTNTSRTCTSDIGISINSQCEPWQDHVRNNRSRDSFHEAMTDVFVFLRDQANEGFFRAIPHFRGSLRYTSEKVYYEPSRVVVRNTISNLSFNSTRPRIAAYELLDASSLMISQVETQGEEQGSNISISLPALVGYYNNTDHGILRRPVVQLLMNSRIDDPLIPLMLSLAITHEPDRAIERVIQENPNTTAQDLVPILENQSEMMLYRQAHELSLFALGISMGDRMVSEVMQNGCNRTIEIETNEEDRQSGLAPLLRIDGFILDPQAEEHIVSHLQARSICFYHQRREELSPENLVRYLQQRID